jgi:iduronate 2-sulfatase
VGVRIEVREDELMKTRSVPRMLASASLTLVFTCNVHATVYDLYYLGGQSNMDGYGSRDTLVPRGIVWMQGESDAYHSEEIALRYEENLDRLMGLIRAALRDPDVPVVVGRISDSGRDDEDEDGKVWNFGDTVRAAQASFVADDACAALVTSTDGYSYSDPWHYDSAGYIDLGTRFAEAILGLEKSCP